MNDTKSPGDKTLHVDVKKTLTLKPKSDASVVRQSFSHGRSKAVLVETKKKRVLKPGETDTRTGKIVTGEYANWTTHPNNPMRVSA